MNYNIKLNQIDEIPCRCEAAELDWGCDSYDMGKFDVILAFEWYVL